MAVPERVVISGVGCCTALGHDLGGVARSLREGRDAFRASGALEGLSVCPAEDWGQDEARQQFESWRHRHYLNRGSRMAVLSGLRALRDAGLEAGLPVRSQIVAAVGPMLDVTGEPGLPPQDTATLGALWLLRWLPNTAAGALARFARCHGEALTVNAACASALQALGEGWRRIRFGLADAVLVAAGDSRLSLGGLLGYHKARALSLCAPSAGPRPFDMGRDGFVPGEGGAAFVLESLSSAQARGAHIHAEILGYGASVDAESLTAPEARGTWAELAVRGALEEAGLDAAALGWLSAHGTGTQLNDQAESLLWERLLGDVPGGPAVMAFKSWLGHGSSACGALELCCALAAWRDGRMPLVRHLERPCSARLDFVREPRPFPSSRGLLENFGFGGQNAALAVDLRP